MKIKSFELDNNNVLQWDTGQITLENNQTPTTYSGTYDFAGDLDKVVVEWTSRKGNSSSKVVKLPYKSRSERKGRL